MEFLKEVLGEELFNQVSEKLKGNEKIKLANIAGGEYVAKEKFNTLEATKNELTTQLKDRDTQLETLKKVDAESLQIEIARLQEENERSKTDFDLKLKQMQLDYAIESNLIKEGAVNTKAVKALLDSSKISLDGENVIGLDEQLKGLKESEKWAFKQIEVPGSGGNPAVGTEQAKQALPTGVQIL